jgi:hypothetical protein
MSLWLREPPRPHRLHLRILLDRLLPHPSHRNQRGANLQTNLPL